MYQVFRNKRTILKSEFFHSYEKARQALRRYIRVAVKKGKFQAYMFSGNQEWDSHSRNPVNFTNMGFTIRKVA
jgi:hypothetical protein